MTIRFKLTLLITFLFLSAIINTIFVFQLEAEGEERTLWVNHTNEVLIESNELLTYLIDSETGQRGYLLTGSTSYLEPYHTGLLGSKTKLDHLKILTSDNPSQVALLNKISDNMQLKYSELKATIGLAQNNDRDAALEIIVNNDGKQYMDRIRDDLTAFVNGERILLEQRKVGYVAYRSQITTLITVELVFFIGLAIFSYFFLQKNLFDPMALLLSGAKKVESGEALTSDDIVSRDEMSHLLATFYSMSEKVFSREERLEFQANHDELTGLKNRVSLYDEIEESMKEIDESNDKIGVLYLDLDKFKQINDTLGHDAGDAILKETAVRLKASVRASDTVYRIGGDEFLVFLREVKSIENVQGVINKIIDSMKDPIDASGNNINTSISIGAAIAPDDTRNSDAIVKYADIAMYYSKRNSEDVYKIFDKTMLKREGDR